jgi:hypothetical protein
MTIVSARSGYDARYYPQRAKGEVSPGGYYIGPAQQGEDPGRWFGMGAEALGFADGQLVEEEPYLKVYAQVDPRTGEKLGRSPGGYAKFGEILARKLAAEPHATAERVLELEREAARETRRSPAYTDTTVSHNKSVSVLRASLLENARRARLAGDQSAEATWRVRARRLAEIEQEANHAALEWAQEWAGFVRTYGGASTRADGVQTGRWERAAPVVTTWLQGTSRDGDPHDHSHNVWARMALTLSDGKWRALDTMALRAQLGAMAAIVESRIRSALAREFGVSWAARDDGQGHEIEGIGQHTLDAFSKRTRAVSRTARKLAQQWEDKYGRAPNAREMKFISDEATYFSRHGKDPALVDWDKLAAGWDATIGGQLAGITSRVCRFGARVRGRGPSREHQHRVIELALAEVQSKHSTWTRSDLMRQLSWSMGPEFDTLPEDAREAMLYKLTDTALGVGHGVVRLEAPEFPAPPPQLIRELDGRSVYTRPGVTRYACKGQLSMEDKLCEQAQATRARVLTREFAAAQLGAEAGELDAQLTARAQDAHTHTRAGLRADQAAMIYQAMTSPRVISVGVGPAGSGKTYTAAAGARAWEASGGKVIGITCSQAARNILVKAGISDSWNSEKFLVHYAAGRIDIQPGTLFVIDEGSMMSMEHLAWLTDLAYQTGGKIFLCGDHAQLAAVESGGGMMLAARRLGYTQLAVPVRFAEEWERDASLRLRLGDQTALENYDEHGRIMGADRALVFAEARRAYVADRLDGQDTLLMAYTREDCRELSRQIRDDLVHLGLVEDGPTVGLSHDVRASVGDMIVAKKNRNKIITDGEGTDREHTLANGDIFCVDAIVPGGVMARRVLEAAEDGSPRFADHAFLYPGKFLERSTDLAYAVTGHSGQGGTVSRGLALITGRESREWLYVALTRGRQRNTAMAVTNDGVIEKEDGKKAVPQNAADPAPGTRPDPELERAERVEQERAGYAPEQPGPVEHQRGPIAVLADAMEREDAELAASDYWRRELANADHLGILGARWNDLAGRADRERHERMVLAAIPGEFHDQVREAMTWISRSLTTAELFGLDPQEVIRMATARPLQGLEHAGKGLQARLAKMTDALVPRPERPFSERVPEAGDPDIQDYLGELGEAQDQRRERLGEHAAEAEEAWAVNVLGPVPEDLVERLDWEQRAGWVASYRERFGVADRNEPLGPEPTNTSPRQRAAWHRAFGAMTRSDAIDFRSLPDRSLVLMAESYTNETAWAPPHVGRQLRDVRLGRETMRLQRIRAEAEAAAAGDQAVAQRHRGLAREAKVLEVLYQAREKILDGAQADREAYERFSAGPRGIAVQAQAEIQRRYPKMKIKPLESAEPWAPEEGLSRPGWLAELEQQRAAFRDELERRQGVEIPDEDPDVQGTEAWPVWRAQKEAILQPPAPEIRPAEKVLERARDGERAG